MFSSESELPLHTPLVCAAWSGRLYVFELLLQQNNIVADLAEGGFTILHQLLDLANKHGESIDVRKMSALVLSGKIDLNIKAEDTGYTPLAMAAALGNLELIAPLLQNSNGDIEAEDRGGNNPAAIAVAKGQTEASLLLSAHEVIDLARNSNLPGMSLLASAAMHGHQDAFEIVLDVHMERAMLSDEQLAGCLHTVVCLSHIDPVPVLMHRITGNSKPAYFAETKALHTAIDIGRLDMVKEIMHRGGIDARHTLLNGESVLQHAGRCLQIVSLSAA
jgi:hypothetical protein